MEVKMKKPESVADWLQLYRLYLSAFPREERKPFGLILRMYKKGTTDVWCLKREGKFAGLGITINGPDLILLDYFAIGKKMRQQGVGSAALPVIVDYYGDKGFFLEIESTLEDAPNKNQRLRRKAFYLSCGLRELHTTAKLFGVNMELLGVRCQLNYDQYKAFYRDHYNQWAADHIAPAK